MNINERELLIKINKKLKDGMIEEAQFLLEKGFLDTGYISFMEYMNRQYINNEKIMYADIDGKQVFSDNNSIYVMNEPFSLELIKEKNFNISPKILLKFLEKVKEDMICSTKVQIHKNISKKKLISIITDKNKQYFHGRHVKPVFGILGSNIEFRLSDNTYILMAENERGKAYILGLEGPIQNDDEFRKFYAKY